MNKKIGIIIYARTSSRRFPNKIFKKIINLRLIEIVIKRLKKINFKKKDFEIIVNTSSNKNDKKLVLFCKKNKIKFYVGSLNNVFKRTYDCLKKNKYEIFVRVNCDRPFVDFNTITKMIKILNRNKDLDIVTNCYKKYPKGLASEVARSKIFLENLLKIKSRDHKEHIFNFFYKNSKKFKILNIKDPLYEKNVNLNLSIDYKKDLKKIIKIFWFFKKNFCIPTSSVLKNITKIKLE